VDVVPERMPAHRVECSTTRGASIFTPPGINTCTTLCDKCIKTAMTEARSCWW
jgi:hypothetical protein